MLGHGIVGVENLGGDLDKIKPGKVFNFFCFPLRWYMGDGAMSRCVALIDEDEIDKSVADDLMGSSIRNDTGTQEELESGRSSK